MGFIVIAVAITVVVGLINRSVTHPKPVAEIGPVGWCAGTKWRVVLPLARADFRRLMFHPSFLVGVFLSPWMFLMATGQEHDWRRISQSIALSLVPLGWTTIIAANLVALRPRRTGADELFASLPAPQPVRSSALLANALGPMLVAAVLAVGSALLVGTRGDDVFGSPHWADIAIGPLIVAGSVTVGVGVARWLPGAIFGVLAAVATAFIQARFLDVTSWPWNRHEGDPMRFLGFIAPVTNAGDRVLEIRPTAWHLLYVGALVIVMVGVTLARDGLARPVGAVLGSSLLVVAFAGWMQTRPVSATQRAEMVRYLTEPAAHQQCEDSAGTRYCAYPGFTDDVAKWRNQVEATLGVLPPAARGARTLEVIQRAPIIVGNDSCGAIAFEESLPPPVAARLSPASVWPADRHVHPGFAAESFPCSDRKDHGFFLAVQTGAWAVGLPPAPHDRNERCTATNQARATIALWAAAAASPDGARTLRDVVIDGSVESGELITFTDWGPPPMWGVDYAVADAQVALALLERPTAEVTEVLAGDWARWTNHATPSSELTQRFGFVRIGASTLEVRPTEASCP